MGSRAVTRQLGDERGGPRRGYSPVRVLAPNDLRNVIGLLMRRPIENVFVASRIRRAGLEAFSLGCQVWGYEPLGRVEAVCHAGTNLVVAGPESAEAAWDAFADFAGPRRMSSSIFGPAAATLGIWRRLIDRWGRAWRKPREVRPHQPLLAMNRSPEVEPHPGVHAITEEHHNAYFAAAVQMYTEEVGVSPVSGGESGYRSYVRQLIRDRQAYGLLATNGQVLFKADVGSVAGGVSQVQGVWLDPALRGRGLAPACMAAVVQQAQTVTPTISLYVNDFNYPALATYYRVGFRQVGEFATILY